MYYYYLQKFQGREGGHLRGYPSLPLYETLLYYFLCSNFICTEMTYYQTLLNHSDMLIVLLSNGHVITPYLVTREWAWSEMAASSMSLKGKAGR